MLKIAPTPELQAYAVTKGVREHPVLTALRNETSKLANCQLQIAPEQGAFMALLAQLMKAKNCLEIGIFTGYSSLWLALAIPADGTITALDISDKHLTLATEHWQAAGVGHKIKPLIAPAQQTLAQLIKTEADFYDLAFIDANKSEYIDYYEYCLKLVRPGGLILIDNVLMYGQVLAESPKKNYVKVLQRLNDLLYNDPRVDICMLMIGDGMTLARKKDNYETQTSA